MALRVIWFWAGDLGWAAWTALDWAGGIALALAWEGLQVVRGIADG